MHIGTVLYGTYEYRTLKAPHLQFSTSTSTDQYNTMQYPYSTCTRPARHSPSLLTRAHHAPEQLLVPLSSQRLAQTISQHLLSRAVVNHDLHDKSGQAGPVHLRTYQGAPRTTTPVRTGVFHALKKRLKGESPSTSTHQIYRLGFRRHRAPARTPLREWFIYIIDSLYTGWLAVRPSGCCCWLRARNRT